VSDDSLMGAEVWSYVATDYDELSQCGERATKVRVREIVLVNQKSTYGKSAGVTAINESHTRLIAVRDCSFQ
jgi:hypothetical protein